MTLHYIKLHYVTLHYITLNYITLHYITLNYITLHTYITYIHTHIHPSMHACMHAYIHTYIIYIYIHSIYLSQNILWMESPVDRWFIPLFVGFQPSTVRWCRISSIHHVCMQLLPEKILPGTVS